LIASGSWDGAVKLWDVRDGKPRLRRTLRGEWDEVEAVAFSPDGTTIAAVGTGFEGAPVGVVTLWTIEEPRGRTLVRETGKIDALAFSPDGEMVAVGSGDRRVVALRDVASGEVQAELRAHHGPIWSVAYAPDGLALAVACGVVPTVAESDGDGLSGEIRLWDLSGPRPRPRARLGGHEYGAISVAYSPDGSTLASGGFDCSTKLWGVEAGREWATLSGHEGWVASVAFSPDGSMLATGSHDQTVKLWDMATGRELATLEGHSGNVYSVAFSPDGSWLASGSLDGTVRLWDVAHMPGLGIDAGDLDG
jgi:WD40 repeat protein